MAAGGVLARGHAGIQWRQAQYAPPSQAGLDSEQQQQPAAMTQLFSVPALLIM